MSADTESAVRPADREATQIECDDCRRRFTDLDQFVDHLESAHGAISGLVEARSTVIHTEEDR